MNFWARIQDLSLTQLARFGFLFLKNPLLIIPTIKASKATIDICNKHFGLTHHSNGIENAFRHALWNVRICEKSLKMTKNRQKSVKWAENVTTLYEKATKNDPLDQLMDLHNNAIGRMLFFDAKTNDFEQYLLKMMLKGVKIDKKEDFSNITHQLVYIS